MRSCVTRSHLRIALGRRFLLLAIKRKNEGPGAVASLVETERTVNFANATTDDWPTAVPQ
jgi:hypothetical protein